MLEHRTWERLYTPPFSESITFFEGPKLYRFVSIWHGWGGCIYIAKFREDCLVYGVFGLCALAATMTPFWILTFDCFGVVTTIVGGHRISIASETG